MFFSRQIATVVVVASFMPVSICFSANDYSDTKWETTYQSLGGDNVKATVYIYGRNGTYVTEGGGGGTLRNMRFLDPNPDEGDPQGVTIIKGDWRWGRGNSTGTFKWRVSGFSSFSGTYLPNNGRDDNPLRRWDGDYAGRAR